MASLELRLATPGERQNVIPQHYNQYCYWSLTGVQFWEFFLCFFSVGISGTNTGADHLGDLSFLSDSQVAKPELRREPKQHLHVHLFISPRQVGCLARQVLVNGKDGVTYSEMPLARTCSEMARFWCPSQFWGWCTQLFLAEIPKISTLSPCNWKVQIKPSELSTFLFLLASTEAV